MIAVSSLGSCSGCGHELIPDPDASEGPLFYSGDQTWITLVCAVQETKDCETKEVPLSQIFGD